jgi:hypothetical protein
MDQLQFLTQSLNHSSGIEADKIKLSALNWKDSLLSGNVQTSLVNLYSVVAKNQTKSLLSFSICESNIDKTTLNDRISEGVIGLGYPLYYIKESLGLKEIPLNISYSFLYKSASLILEAERHNFKNAILILSSLNSSAYVEHFESFSKLFNCDSKINIIFKSPLLGRVNFYFGFFEL